MKRLIPELELMTFMSHDNNLTINLNLRSIKILYSYLITIFTRHTSIGPTTLSNQSNNVLSIPVQRQKGPRLASEEHPASSHPNLPQLLVQDQSCLSPENQIQ